LSTQFPIAIQLLGLAVALPNDALAVPRQTSSNTYDYDYVQQLIEQRAAEIEDADERTCNWIRARLYICIYGYLL
jgi:hypothetical protein